MTTLPQTAAMRLPRAVVPSQVPSSVGPYGGGGGHAAVAAPQQGLTGADVWRVIRGNLWLIIIMVMASAVAGWVVNSQLAKHWSKYTAVGLMKVSTPREIPMPGQAIYEAQPAEVSLEQGTQTKMLMHYALFQDVLQDEDSKVRQTKWYAQFKDHIELAKEDLDKNWIAEPIPDSRLIRVSMTYSDPEDARTIVREMVTKHIAKVHERQRDVEQKKVAMLTKEQKSLEIELNEEVLKSLRQKEQDLGMDQMGTSVGWNGRQFQLDRLLQEQARVQAELAGYRSRLNTLKKDLDEGRTPAEVEAQINNSGRYLNARQRVDDIDVEIDQLTLKLGPHHEMVTAWKQRRVMYAEKVAETREDLRSTYSETMKSMLQNEIDAAAANAGRIEDAIQTIASKIADMNKTMIEYRQLQDRQQELQKKQSFLREEITKITQFSINADFATASWAAEPQKPDLPSFPILWKTLTASVFIGLALSLGIAFLREMTDNTVRSPRDIARVGQLNLLGMVPHEADDPQAAGGRLQLAIFDAPHSIIAEQFRSVRTKLQYGHSLDTTRSLLVTSPSPGDGKTTVACNLAGALALNGRRILLVDANFRRPSLHTVFGGSNDVGFADVLANADLLDTAVRETDVPNLSLLPAGAKPANPAELLESQLFADFIDRALEQYDHVIFDSGPLLMVSDAVAMAPRVDGVITVVRARGNSRGLLMRLRDELRKIKAEHLGVVLNAVRAQGGGYYGRNIKTYYAYQNA